MMVADVDLPAKRVWIRQPVVEVEGRLVRNPTPKGGRNRAVVVGPELARLLREHLIRKGMPAGDEPLLTSPHGKGFRWNNYFARTLRPAIESAATRWAAPERRRLLARDKCRSGRPLACLISQTQWGGADRPADPGERSPRPPGEPENSTRSGMAPRPPGRLIAPPQ